GPMLAFLRYPRANLVELGTRNIVELCWYPDSDEAGRWASFYPKLCYRKNQLHLRSFELSHGWKFPPPSPDLQARCRRNALLPARYLLRRLPRKGTHESANRRPKEQSV